MAQQQAYVPALRLEEWDHLKIAVREKPLSEEERARVEVMIKTDNDKLIAFYPDSREGLLYNYDYFFPEDTTQMDVFQTVGMEMVELVMNGYSACCLAYGPSATGKTHSLFGSDQEPGLIQLTTKELLHRFETSPQNLQFTVKFSYWEMNNTEIRDALQIENTANLPVRKNKQMGGVYIPGLTEVDITSWNELDDYIMHGNINRIRLSEERGARWHGFLKLKITMEDAERPNHMIYTTLTFGHLKGSDRVGRKGAAGEVLRHGSSINQSITILGSAMLHAVEMRRRKLAEADPSEVDRVQDALPELSESIFTESKLCQVLTGPLSGTVATVMIGTVSTLEYHETTDTLENLQNAQQITCALKRAVHVTQAGKVWRQLQDAESQLPQTQLAAGHPLTEIEEKVRKLQEQYAHLLARSQRPDTPPTQAGEPPPLRSALETDPRHHQPWKQNVIKSKIHGSRNTIYVPTEGKIGQIGNTYKGQWKAGLKEGWGLQLTELTKYEGEWRSGRREGRGTLWRRGDAKAAWVRVYKGEWRKDKPHGRGIKWYPNGDVYEGYFEDGRRAAVGKIFLANGDKIEGQWKADMVEGWATLYLKNGDRFEGHWSRGMKEGPGVWYYEGRQQVYRGEWVKDVAKCGTVEDMAKKTTNEASHFIPRVEVKDHEKLLEKEREKIKQRRLADHLSSGGYPDPDEDYDEDEQDAAGREVDPYGGAQPPAGLEENIHW
eukprot:TRINITY_DN253_c1_g1_i1.p1 TRINITY_DN253_c1_g1~~TRINITY_DN253_c1_g1_i1.p1  ORF type:complete len:720 (+),score=289.68 TRINITY_DN253_c1_g1_i1:83-2242(+)